MVTPITPEACFLPVHVSLAFSLSVDAQDDLVGLRPSGHSRFILCFTTLNLSIQTSIHRTGSQDMDDLRERPRPRSVLLVIAGIAFIASIASLSIALSTDAHGPPQEISLPADAPRLLSVDDLPAGWRASTSWSNVIEGNLGGLHYASFYQGSTSDHDAWLSIELRNYTSGGTASALFVNEVRNNLDSPAGAGCSNITLGDGALLVRSPENSQGVNCSGYTLIFIKGCYVCTIDIGYKDEIPYGSDFMIDLAQKELVKLGSAS
jgi:hypothetical protein